MATLPISDAPEYREAVQYLRNWQNGGDSFSSLFFTMLSKADTGNYRRLEVAFPYWVAAFEDWQAAPSSDAFFEQYK